MRAATLVVLVLGGLPVPSGIADRRPVPAGGADQQVITRFVPGRQGGVILPVTLNGRGPFRFLLDTGSTHSAISEAAAAEVQAPVVAKTTVGSVAGSRAALVVRIDELRFGPVVARALLASLVDLEEVGRAEGIQGVIGQDALAPLRYTIDFRQRQVLWWPARGGTTGGTTFDLEMHAGRFLVSLPQPRTVLRLVPDSGASTVLLFGAGRQLPLALVPDRAGLTTTSARKTVRLARIRDLYVGLSRLRDVATVVVERDASEPAGVDGLLPLHLFDRVTFDGPRRQLIVEGVALMPA